MKLLILLALAVALHAEDALVFSPLSSSVNNMTVVQFVCDLGESEEQGFTKCPDMTIDRWTSTPSPEWALTLTMTEVCPTNDAALIATHGPVGIAWPESLVFNIELSEDCNVKPWLYYHDEPNGSYIGLWIDPRTQRLSVEQSEVAFR